MVTCDILGAFMQADMDELVHMKLEGELAELLMKVDELYAPAITYECGQPVIYSQLDKALYGALQAALLFWQRRSKFFEAHGFEANPYDSCVMNKTIDNKQCMMGWHIDGSKISHIDQGMVNSILVLLENKFRKKTPLMVTAGPIHEYLGMTIDFGMPGKVCFTLKDYVQGMIDECPKT